MTARGLHALRGGGSWATRQSPGRVVLVIGGLCLSERVRARFLFTFFLVAEPRRPLNACSHRLTFFCQFWLFLWSYCVVVIKGRGVSSFAVSDLFVPFFRSCLLCRGESILNGRVPVMSSLRTEGDGRVIVASCGGSIVVWSCGRGCPVKSREISSPLVPWQFVQRPRQESSRVVVIIHCCR